MTSHDDPSPPRSWRLPAEWLREEKLWRDVLTRVIAGVITAGVIYAGALLLGYLNSPEISAGALLALGIAGAGLLVAIAAALLASLPRRGRDGLPRLGRGLTAVLLVLAAAAILVGVIADVTQPS